MKRPISIAIAVAIIIAVVAGGGYLWWKKKTTPPPTVQYTSIADIERDISRLEPFLKAGDISWQDSYTLGIAYVQAGRIADAKTAFLESERRYPKFFKTFESLGMVYFRLGDMEKAVEKWGVALSLDPKAEHIKEMIERARHRIATAERIKELEPLIEGNKADFGKRFELSLLYLGSGRVKEARQMLLDIVKAKKDSPEAYSALARAEAMSGNIDSAISAVKAGLRLRPNDASLSQMLSELEMMKKERPGAGGAGR